MKKPRAIRRLEFHWKYRVPVIYYKAESCRVDCAPSIRENVSLSLLSPSSVPRPHLRGIGLLVPPSPSVRCITCDPEEQVQHTPCGC